MSFFLFEKIPHWTFAIWSLSYFFDLQIAWEIQFCDTFFDFSLFFKLLYHNPRAALEHDNVKIMFPLCQIWVCDWSKRP